VAAKIADDNSRERPAPEPSLTARWILENVFALLRQYGNSMFLTAVFLYAIKKGSESLVAFAGKTSIASLALKLATELNSTVSISVTVAGLTSYLYWNEFRRHRKTRERLTSRITMLELKLDPNRSSSSLTSQGMTQEHDK